MRWKVLLIYLPIILVLFTGLMLLYPLSVGWTFMNVTNSLFAEGMILFIFGVCLSVRLCDEVVYYHRPVNPALVRDVQENPISRGRGIREGGLAFFAASGIILAITALLYLLAPLLPLKSLQMPLPFL